MSDQLDAQSRTALQDLNQRLYAGAQMEAMTEILKA